MPSFRPRSSKDLSGLILAGGNGDTGDTVDGVHPSEDPILVDSGYGGGQQQQPLHRTQPQSSQSQSGQAGRMLGKAGKFLNKNLSRGKSFEMMRRAEGRQADATANWSGGGSGGNTAGPRLLLNNNNANNVPGAAMSQRMPPPPASSSYVPPPSRPPPPSMPSHPSSNLLPGDTPFGVRSPRSPPTATSPGSPRGFLPPSTRDTPPRFSSGNGAVQTRLASPPNSGGSRIGNVETVYRGGGQGGPTSSSVSASPHIGSMSGTRSIASTTNSVSNTSRGNPPPPPPRANANAMNNPAVRSLNERMDRYKVNVDNGGTQQRQGGGTSPPLPSFDQVNRGMQQQQQQQQQQRGTPSPGPRPSSPQARAPSPRTAPPPPQASSRPPRPVTPRAAPAVLPAVASNSRSQNPSSSPPRPVSPRAAPAVLPAVATANIRSQNPSSPPTANNNQRQSQSLQQAQRRSTVLTKNDDARNNSAPSSPASSSALTHSTTASSDRRHQPTDDEEGGGYNTEGMNTTDHTASSHSRDVGLSTSIDDDTRTYDDSRTYDTGTVGSNTYAKSHDEETATYGEETATYMSGTACTDGDTYQSFGSAYHTSRSFQTNEDDDGEDTAKKDVEAGKRKKKGSRMSRWKRGRRTASKYDEGIDDDDNTFDYAAFDDTKPSRGRSRVKKSSRSRSYRGRNGRSVGSPRNTRPLSPTPSVGSDTIDNYIKKKEEQEFHYTKQRYGYLSIALTVVQTLVLAFMLAFCGIAPIDVNSFVGPYPDALSEWGAKNPYLMIEEGQWWRLFTPELLNIGVLHLLCNAYVQLETSAFFEREWGSIRWFIIYFGSAIGSTVVSSILDPNTISVGSSGALMGIFGAKLAEVLTLTVFDTFHRRDSTAIEQLGGTLCSLVVVCVFCAMPMVDWSGHLGGVATGFFLGIVMFGKYIRKLNLKALWQLLGLVFLGVGTWLAVNELLNEVQPKDELGDACEYYKSLFVDGYDCTCKFDNAFEYNNYENADDDAQGDDQNAAEDENADQDMNEDNGEDGDAERMLRRMLLRWIVK